MICMRCTYAFNASQAGVQVPHSNLRPIHIHTHTRRIRCIQCTQTMGMCQQKATNTSKTDFSHTLKQHSKSKQLTNVSEYIHIKTHKMNYFHSVIGIILLAFCVEEGKFPNIKFSRIFFFSKCFFGTQCCKSFRWQPLPIFSFRSVIIVINVLMCQQVRLCDQNKSKCKQVMRRRAKFLVYLE